jgi:hypothetical protein
MVENTGGSELDWNARPSASWIVVKPATGKLAPSGKQQFTIALNPLPTQTGNSEDDATVTITSNGGAVIIKVHFVYFVADTDSGVRLRLAGV